MLALGRFYKDEDVFRLQTQCRPGIWTFDSLKKALNDLDTQDPINEHESRDIVHIKNFLSQDDVRSINKCFDGPVRKASFQAGTDAGNTSSWCKYLYIKDRKDKNMYHEFQGKGLTAAVETKIHEEVMKSLTDYESACFGEFFPQQKAREISIVVST